VGQKRVAVIGAGIGGLSAATRLADAGYRVHVFEKNPDPGGKARVLQGGGFRFDKGPSLLTMPFVFHEYFKDLRENFEDYLSFERLEINCQYFFSDRSIINAYADKEMFSAELSNKTKDTGENVERFFKHCQQLYDMAAEMFLFNSPLQTLRQVNTRNLSTLARINALGMFTPLDKVNRDYFHDPRTVQLFNRYATYNGSSPFHTPATFLIIPHVEFAFGAYNVIGGIYSIPNALYRLAMKKGVSFHFRRDVRQIIHEDHRIRGLRLETGDFDCDIVVANSDVRNTYNTLLGDHNSPLALLYNRKEPSSSTLVFYWGVKGDFDSLQVHNIFFSSDYHNEFKEIFRDRKCPRDPTVYINITSKYEKSHAPRRCENWFVMINAPYAAGQNWADETKKTRRRILEKLSKAINIDIENRIIFESVWTPIDIEKETGSSMGSLYGMASNSLTGAFMRQQNKSFLYRGLYFCGGTSHPGGGMPLALLSGKIAADFVKRDES
jgi:phytoene desaturase